MYQTLIKINKDYPGFILVVNIILSIVLGFASSYIFKFTPELGFLTGLLFAFSLSILQLTLTSRELEQKIYHLDSKIQVELIKEEKLKKAILQIIDAAQTTLNHYPNDYNKLTQVDSLFRESVFINLESCLNVLKRISAGSLRIVHYENPDFWTKLINCTSNSFFTTNVTNKIGGSYGRKDDPETIFIQSEAVKRIKSKSGSFIRLFVIESEEPEQNLINIFTSQKNAGIDVRYIKRELFDEIGDKNSGFDKIGSSDFSIIDDKFLYLTLLEKSSGISTVELSNDQLRIKDAKIIEKMLLNVSRKFELTG
jgi:hypothetical protein